MSSLTLPSASEIEALHRKYAPTESVFELVFTHCKIVSDIVTQSAEKSGANVDIEFAKVTEKSHLG